MLSTEANAPLVLEPALLFARGQDRECYVHPHDPGKCIKLTVSGDFTQEKQEAAYFRRMIRRGISFQKLAKFHGSAATNLGTGLVFELIRDADTSISNVLAWYLADESRTPPVEELRAHLLSLLEYLLSERIIARDLRSKNIVCRRLDGSGTRVEWIVIDGLGNNEFLPVSEWLPWATRRKILRKWREFESHLIRAFPNNRALAKALEGVGRRLL